MHVAREHAANVSAICRRQEKSWLTLPTKVPSDSLGRIGSLKRTSDKSLFPMALGSCGHRITHQLRPINMNGRSILSVTSWLVGLTALPRCNLSRRWACSTWDSELARSPQPVKPLLPSKLGVGDLPFSKMACWVRIRAIHGTGRAREGLASHARKRRAQGAGAGCRQE